MMSKEAMKLALEALKRSVEGGPTKLKMDAAITALREALAEPQEKYIYGTPLLDAMTGKVNEALDKMAENAREMGLDYEMPITMQEGEFDCTHAERLCAELKAAHPVTPCTHPSLGACSLREDGTASRWNCVMCGTEFVPKATNRWAEFNETTKRNIKHAEWYLSTHSNLSQQNPTAWILKCGEQQELWWEKPPFGDAIALYTSPPAQRPWVGLTDEEKRQIFEREDYQGWRDYINAIEAKLRSKNEDPN